ncbi:hypothetical protein ACP70R_033054 [Stipagrostis hirtigluma subsp. patula]
MTVEISRVALLQEVTKQLGVKPPLCLSNPVDGHMHVACVILVLEDDNAPGGTRSENMYSKPRKSEKEAMEEAADKAINFLGDHAKAVFNDINYEHKAILELRQAQVINMRNDMCLENERLQKKVKCLKIGWKKTMQGVNKIMKNCGDSSAIRLNGKANGPLYPEFSDQSYLEPVKSGLFRIAERLADIHDEATKNKVFPKSDR